MAQLKHNPKTMDELFILNERITELLTTFVTKHPEFQFNSDMFIGESEHNIVVTVIDNTNAETVTGLS